MNLKLKDSLSSKKYPGKGPFVIYDSSTELMFQLSGDAAKIIMILDEHSHEKGDLTIEGIQKKLARISPSFMHKEEKKEYVAKFVKYFKEMGLFENAKDKSYAPPTKKRLAQIQVAITKVTLLSDGPKEAKKGKSALANNATKKSKNLTIGNLISIAAISAGAVLFSENAVADCSGYASCTDACAAFYGSSFSSCDPPGTYWYGTINDYNCICANGYGIGCTDAASCYS